MPRRPYLLFRLRGHTFATRSDGVQEVARLATLEPLAEVPPHVAGLLDLRGDWVPVVDLAIRMGYEPVPLDPSQAIVVLRRDDRRTGVLVDGVEGMEDVEEDAVEEVPEAPAGVVPSEDVVVRRLARVNGKVAVIIALEDVVFDRRPEDLRRPGGRLAPRMAELSDEARRVLDARARALAERAVAVAAIETPPLIRLRIGGEDFAVAARSVLEFVRLEDLAPVPSCPGHVAGHTSLRGDILVVVDPRELLGVTQPRPEGRTYAMLVRSPQGSAFALLVDEVIDVMQARRIERMPPNAGGSSYVQASAWSDDRRVPVIDVETLAAAPELVVQEDA